MGSIGKFFTDDLFGIVQYPDVKHASAQYDQAYQNTQKQAQDALDRANQGYGEAKGYRDQAGGIYGNLSTQGMSERDAALAMLNKVLGEYGSTAGVATPLSYQPNSATPANRTPPGAPGSAASVLNRTTPPSAPAAAPSSTAAPIDAYALTDPQQIQANAQVDEINSEKQSAIDDLKALYAQRGITDPRAIQAGIQSISERYDAIASQTKARFAEGARANRQQTLEGAVDFFANLMKGGTATTAGAAGGLQSVGGQAQNLGDTQSQISANLNSNLTGGAANRLQATQEASHAFDADFMNLLALWASGGLSGLGAKAKTPPIVKPYQFT